MNHEEQQKTKNEDEDEDEAIGRDLAFALRRRYGLIPYADTIPKSLAHHLFPKFVNLISAQASLTQQGICFGDNMLRASVRNVAA